MNLFFRGSLWDLSGTTGVCQNILQAEQIYSVMTETLPCCISEIPLRKQVGSEYFPQCLCWGSRTVIVTEPNLDWKFDSAPFILIPQ